MDLTQQQQQPSTSGSGTGTSASASASRNNRRTTSSLQLTRTNGGGTGSQRGSGSGTILVAEVHITRSWTGRILTALPQGAHPLQVVDLLHAPGTTEVILVADWKYDEPMFGRVAGIEIYLAEHAIPLELFNSVPSNYRLFIEYMQQNHAVSIPDAEE